VNRWKGLSSPQLCQKAADPKLVKLGYAVTEKDDISGLRYWVSYDAEGGDRLAYDYGVPLVFPPDTMDNIVIVVYKKEEK